MRKRSGNNTNRHETKIAFRGASWCFVVLFIFASSGYAQHQHGAATAKTYPAAVNITQLPPPVLMSGIGTSDFTITTRSADAQKFFNQGVNLLHCFWDVEAYRAFRKAAQQDETAPMAYWGIYTSLAQNSSEMAEERSAALKKAVELMPGASDREKYYIRAISLQAEPGKGRAAWISEMEALIDKYPDDVEAKLFLANSLSSAASSYAPDGRPRDGKLYGQAILKNLLITNPEHAAVHHYWIHAMENSSRPWEALPSVEKLPKLAPKSGHMVHMPGHIYYRLGEYEKGRELFERSAKVDEAYMKAQNIHPINNWNYVHNLEYLVADCAEEGRYRDAVRYAKMLEAIPADAQRLKATGLGYILYGGHTALTRLQMRFGRWNDAIRDLTALNPGARDETLPQKYQTALLSFLKGMSAIERSDTEEASRQSAALDAAVAALATERSQQGSDWYFSSANRILPVHAQDLKGNLLSAQGRHEEAKKLLLDVVERERNLGYWEPPHYTRPVLESLGNALMRDGKYGDAAQAFEEELKIRPNSGFAYLGMARAYVKDGNTGKARDSYRKFLAAWKNADKGLAEIAEANSWLKNNK
jgi:tetratricopeptide (TPR) repeat protein